VPEILPGTVFDHIAIAMPRIADAPAVLAGELGGVPDRGGRARAYRFGQWRFRGGARLEVLEPAGADGFLHRFLERHGPRIHHVTFRVPSLARACDRARAQGYDIVGYDDSDRHWKEAFLHPRQALGIVVQMVESEPGGGGEGANWTPPPGPPDPPPPVAVRGLRMRARSRERARAQWELILDGAPVRDGAPGVLYEWPGSPMRLAVEIAPDLAEGPIAIAYSSERPLALPAGPHPVLGTVLSASPL